MVKDPIVEEVRAARAEMFKQAGGTLDGLVAYLREQQRVRPARKVVSYKARPARCRQSRRVRLSGGQRFRVTCGRIEITRQLHQRPM